MKQEKIVEHPEAPEAPDNAGKQADAAGQAAREADAAEQVAREAERRMLRLESQVAQLSRLTAEDSDSGVGWVGTGTIYRGFVETSTVQRMEAPWTPVVKNDDATGWQIEFRHCGYVRGPVTRILGTLGPYALGANGGAGDYYVGVRINTETGNTEEAPTVSKTSSDVYDATPPKDEFFKKLICVLTYREADEEAGVEESWSIKTGCYGRLPELGAYV